MQLTEVLISIVLMAIITFFTRLFPFLFFQKKDPPLLLIFIEKYIPPMVMVILVIYCLRDVKWTILPYGLPEALAVILVALIHIRLKNPLLSIFGGTIFYMFTIQSNWVEKFFSFLG